MHLGIHKMCSYISMRNNDEKYKIVTQSKQLAHVFGVNVAVDPSHLII